MTEHIETEPLATGDVAQEQPVVTEAEAEAKPGLKLDAAGSSTWAAQCTTVVSCAGRRKLWLPAAVCLLAAFLTHRFVAGESLWAV